MLGEMSNYPSTEPMLSKAKVQNSAVRRGRYMFMIVDIMDSGIDTSVQYARAYFMKFQLHFTEVSWLKRIKFSLLLELVFSAFFALRLEKNVRVFHD